MEFLVVGGFFGLVWVLLGSGGLNTSRLKVDDVPLVIDSLLKEESNFKLKPVEEKDAISVVRSVYGSHHRYDGVQAARILRSDSALFVARADVVIEQLNYEMPQGDATRHEVWWLFYQQKDGEFSVSFRGWQVEKLQVNGIVIANYQTLRGPLGSLRGVGARALRQLQLS